MSQTKKEFVYGIHAVRHALEKSPETALELWLKEEKKVSPELQAIITLAKQHGIVVQSVKAARLDEKAKSGQHQGVVLSRRGKVEKQEQDLEAWLKENDEKRKLFLVLDNIQDPHNLGACLRTADAAAVDAVIIPRDKSAGLTSVAIKVASGAAETVTLYTVTNLARALRLLQKHNVWVIGTDGETNKSLYDVEYTTSTALVLGAEGKGLRENTRKQCDELVSIPMQGTVESLNVSVATGICLFEVLRQRNQVI